MTMTADQHDFSDRTDATPQQMPVAVQIISTVTFAAFAIPVTIVALNVFWPAGVAIAIILAWRGGFAPTGSPPAAPRNVEEAVKSLMPTQAQKASGNASFDAYRADMIARLEAEQDQFDGFLGRLRDAKDQSEFDAFMDERARRVEDMHFDDDRKD